MGYSRHTMRRSRSLSSLTPVSSSYALVGARSVADLATRPYRSSWMSTSPSFPSYLGITEKSRGYDLHNPYYHGTPILKYPRSSNMYPFDTYGIWWPYLTGSPYYGHDTVPAYHARYNSATSYSPYHTYYDKYSQRGANKPHYYSYLDSVPFTSYWEARLSRPFSTFRTYSYDY